MTPIRVYVVEDYRLTRLGIVSALKEAEHIDLVGDGESAEDFFRFLNTHDTDVVLMDIGLPGMSGIEAIGKLKTSHPNLSVIMLTSHDNEDEVLAALTGGASAYCMKDIPTEKLMDVIQEVHDGAVWLDPHIAQVALKLFQHKDVQDLAQNTTSSPEEDDNPHNLTPKEQEALSAIVQGKSNSEIAHEMGITVHTVKAHVSSVLSKLAVFDRVQAAVKAVREELV
jgi:DNA-binding NarL/FixJ family response regulator